MEHVTKTLRAQTTTMLPSTGRPRLLLVEHDFAFARTLVRRLAELDVTHVVDGVAASAALTTSPFDLVLSDISFADASGGELLRLVRAYDLEVPVILMTGTPALETAMEAIELGALQYLIKPVPIEQLRQVLARGMTLRRNARGKREAAKEVTRSPLGGGDGASLIVSFERALASMRLAFQPIVDARKRKIVAYEALMRSREPSLPDPAAVLDAAERLGAVHRLGRRIRALAAQSLERLPGENTLLFVNLHAIDLTDPELYCNDMPLSASAGRIVLEVTERLSLDGLSDATQRVRCLRDQGYRIALDDLGAGYAGLSTFTTIEPEFVKLDMSLVRGIAQSITKQRVVGSILCLCRELSMRVVAEGIETREELACVVELGCDLLQGYYLGKPSETPATDTVLEQA